MIRFYWVKSHPNPKVDRALAQWLQGILGVYWETTLTEMECRFHSVHPLRVCRLNEGFAIGLENDWAGAAAQQLWQWDEGIPLEPSMGSGGFVPAKLDKAVVQAWEKWFAQQRDRIPLWFFRQCWPGGKSFALAITHDVDLTRPYGPRRILQLLRQGKAKEASTLLGQWMKGTNPYWVYPELMAFYHSHGIRATFFFLARAWEGTAYRYRIKNPPFRKLLHQLLEEGHEIGLHSSRYCFDHPGRLFQEKKRLERVLGQKVTGVRQHYLNLKFPDAWKLYADAGFAYDTSAGFNHEVGLAMGTAHPYPAIHPTADTRNLLELPFAIMDYPWKAGRSLEAAWSIYQGLLTHIQKIKGMFNVIWHPSNLAEADFRPLWDQFIFHLNFQDAWLTTLGELAAWWNALNTTHWHVEGGDNQYALYIRNSATLTDLTFDLVSSHAVRITAAAGHLQQIGKTQWRWVMPVLPPGEHRLPVKVLWRFES